MKSLPFRQVHLDFHTSPHITGIGARFDKAQWQATLRAAEVNSITLFSKCHHGWSYHETRVGKRHPGLSFDLLRAQFDACKEAGIRAPIYLSAGLDDVAAEQHPEWLELDVNGAPVRVKPLQAGFQKLCFLSSYLDYLCAQIEEVVQLFPNCDGIFLDIINQRPGCSPGAMKWMAENRLDATQESSRQKAAEAALMRYYERTTAAARSGRTDMPVFHNAGHIERGRRESLAFQSHLELESLPTGGWGYDHFPESAAYAAGLGLAYLGMTGKFHTTWGEVGGYKHPDALRYECAAMLAFGAACSVGDQLSPGGDLDPSTYGIIGAAYREVKAKEAWCEGTALQAGIGIFSAASEERNGKRENASDTGAVRMLLEEHLPFALLDREMDFSPFAVIIFPDVISFDDALLRKTRAYLDGGGKIMLTGKSGLNPDGSGFVFETGATWAGESPFEPDYVLPVEGLRPDHVQAPFVHYLRSQRIKIGKGTSLGEVFDPWFNRTYEHFSGHQHAPPRPEASGYDCGSLHGPVLYLAHPVFASYRAFGHFTCRQYAIRSLRRLLGDDEQVRTNLPSSARLTVLRQEQARRWIAHLLYAPTIPRGGDIALDGGTTQSVSRRLDVIEDLIPLRDIEVEVKLPIAIKKVTLAPEGTEVPFSQDGGRIKFKIDRFTCHQMVVLQE